MKKIFLLIVLSYILIFILTPPLNSPDEPEHYENSFWLSRFIYPYQPKNKAKPKLFVDNLMAIYLPLNFADINHSPLKHMTYSDKEIRQLKPVTLQSYHPPLYFLIISVSHHLANVFHIDYISRFYLARIFSAFFYFGIVYFAYRILQVLFTGESVVAVLLLFFALNPLVVKSGVGINPDIGMTFFSLWFLCLLLQWQKKKVVDFRQTVVLAVIAVAATLSKFSGVFTFVIYPIYVYIKNKLSQKTMLLTIIFFGIGFLFLLPWFSLNWSRYATLSSSAFYIAENQPLQPHGIAASLLLAGFEFRHTIMHFSGFLGATNEFNPPKIFFLAYTVIVSLLSLTGLVMLLKEKKKRRHFLWLIVHFISLVAFLYMLGVYFKKQGFSWDLQGRYFVTGFLALTVFIYFALQSILNKKVKMVNAIICLAAIIHFYYIIGFVLIPAYYRWSKLLSELRSLYPLFDLIFVASLASHLLLSFSITNKLFNPSSKER